MEKEQIQSEINRVSKNINVYNDKISNLSAAISNENTSLAQYQNMNKKINEALEYLNNAKKNLNEAIRDFKSSYSSDNANKQRKYIEDTHNSIEDVRSELMTILQVSNDRISDIRGNINRYQANINSYERTIRSMTWERQQLRNDLNSL